MHFNITNNFDLTSNHHVMTLDVHLGSSSFCILNLYHDTDNLLSLRNILNLELDPVIPMIVGSNFNMHSWTWSPPRIRPSPWALDLEDWALSQTLHLVNELGVRTHRGKGQQWDMTLDLVWVNAAAVLDEAFHDLTVDFDASIGSDHTGLKINYQHAMDLAIEQNPHLPLYLIEDEAKDIWIRHFNAHLHFAPANLSSAALIDFEADCLSQDIEETCRSIFKQSKPFLPKAAVWWDKECSKAAAAVCEADTPNTWKDTHKALVKTVCVAKRNWVNRFLHDTTPECLWSVAKW
jgi:hypothetical protein